MINSNDLIYLGKKIQKQLWTIESDNFNMIMNDLYNGEADVSALRASILWRIKYVHEQILCFLEMKGLRQWMDKFKEEFGDKMNDEGFLLETDGGSDEHDPELIITQRFHSYLTVFSEFDSTPPIEDEGSDRYEYNGFEVLSDIIKSTQHIIENSGHTVTNETSIYNQVEWVLRMIFTSTRRVNKSRFISDFKNYEPDILIPELRTAIEFKYIRDGKDVGTHIDQVKTDADNYKGDPEYDNFYAVFYISSQKIVSEKSILAAWENKRFPKNWRPFVVFGK
jgi:hypothetical protein